MPVDLNARIRGRMAELGLVQADLAVVLGISANQISERLLRKVPWKVHELQAVAAHLQTTVAYLVGETPANQAVSA